MALGKKLRDLLVKRDRRRSVRREPVPPLIAFYWDGATPVPHAVLDASARGFYLLTEHRWYPGTIVALTLQRSGAREHEPDRSVSVNARAVRTGPDGVGFEFLLYGMGQSEVPAAALPAYSVDAKELGRFLDRVRAGGKAS